MNSAGDLLLFLFVLDSWWNDTRQEVRYMESFQFHVSCFVSRFAACLSGCLSTVQETDKIGLDGNGYS